MTDSTPSPVVSRRAFVTGASASFAAGALTAPLFARTPRRREDTLHVGVIGCGGRGTGAAVNALQAGADVKVTALADLFPDRLNGCRGHLANHDADRATVADDHCFTGFDAYRELLAHADVDLVILATPPHFRPMHFDAAVRAGKHVFMEKPVAVDPTGVRLVIETAQRARDAKLSVVAGTQRRHEQCYLEAMEQLANGAIGDVMHTRVYWNQQGLWHKDPQPEWSEMEWQLRNWLYFTWLSGDHICEQHIHNIDVSNWVMGAHPVRATGLGGRQSRTDAKHGHIFDHFAVDFEYADGRTMLSMCRQQDGTPGRVEEVVHGTNGTMVLSSNRAMIADGTWRFRGRQPNPYTQEHVDLQASVRGGTYLNEGVRVAESTLTAIMGRMACYTGQVLEWDQVLNSTLDLSPAAYSFGSAPMPPVAMPGRTEFA